MKLSSGALAVLIAIGGAGLLACDSTHPIVTFNQVPDFALIDVNETSTTAGRAVSPRDHLGKVSAWYFGHAT
ncbi:MAG: hypothetical protein AAF533_11860 [Acidobacteriota bacterium]